MSKESKIGALLVLMVVLLFIFAPSSETRDSRIFANQYRLIFKETPGLEENYFWRAALVCVCALRFLLRLLTIRL